MSDLHREIEIVEEAVLFASGGIPLLAWQRLKARLTPDREQVAWRLFKIHMACGETKAARLAFEEYKPMWLRQADDAIKAMEGNDDA